MYERLRATTFLPSRKSAETFCSSNLYISDTVNGSDSSDRALATPALWPPKPVYGLWILSFVYYFSEYVFASVMQLKRVVIYEHNFIYAVVTSCEYCPACNPPPRPCEYCPAKQLSDSDSSKKSRRKKKPAFAGSLHVSGRLLLLAVGRSMELVCDSGDQPAKCRAVRFSGQKLVTQHPHSDHNLIICLRYQFGLRCWYFLGSVCFSCNFCAQDVFLALFIGLVAVLTNPRHKLPKCCARSLVCIQHIGDSTHDVSVTGFHISPLCRGKTDQQFEVGSGFNVSFDRAQKIVSDAGGGQFCGDCFSSNHLGFFKISS